MKAVKLDKGTAYLLNYIKGALQFKYPNKKITDLYVIETALIYYRGKVVNGGNGNGN